MGDTLLELDLLLPDAFLPSRLFLELDLTGSFLFLGCDRRLIADSFLVSCLSEFLPCRVFLLLTLSGLLLLSYMLSKLEADTLGLLFLRFSALMTVLVMNDLSLEGRVGCHFLVPISGEPSLLSSFGNKSGFMFSSLYFSNLSSFSLIFSNGFTYFTSLLVLWVDKFLESSLGLILSCDSCSDFSAFFYMGLRTF
jgi:hypothetical protein